MMPTIRLRAAIAVIENKRILLVPHFDTDTGPLQWVIPGGGVEFCERIETAAAREFQEETGYTAVCDRLLTVYENIVPARPWHSVTFIYSGRIIGGQLQEEQTHWGLRTPRWFGKDDLIGTSYHPLGIVEMALQTGAASSD
jgi:ADP-ribose pyrophosphatase YjhB (NUDIX family)